MKLAIHDGNPVRTELFPAYRTIGAEEKEAVNRVMDSGVLSKYLGCWHPDFYGGDEVQALEREWAEKFSVKHAIAVNSCTSGLYASIGALNLELGDEVIVSPYTMCASATAPLIYNAIPVFADIEKDFFCLDLQSIEERVTDKTKAILIVDIFGLPYDASRINAYAKEKGLFVIEDAAQAPGALHEHDFAGTLGDIGVYSLNYHKHIHCGEGGMVVTDDDVLAEKIRLIRNHAEAVVADKGTENLVNMIGFNFRMTELEASIARCQLKKLDSLLKERQENCSYLSERLTEIPALTPPLVRPGCTHSYYVHAFKFDAEMAGGVSRDRFIDAVRAELPATTLREAEGPLLSSGYVTPLYLQPLFQKKTAYGRKGFPFSALPPERNLSYEKGICPVAEKLQEKELFLHELMRPQMMKDDLEDVVEAFMKVWNHREELT